MRFLWYRPACMADNQLFSWVLAFSLVVGPLDLAFKCTELTHTLNICLHCMCPPPYSECCHGITHRMRLHTRHLVFFSQKAPEEHPGQTHTQTLTSQIHVVNISLDKLICRPQLQNVREALEAFLIYSNFFSGIRFINLPCWITFWTGIGSVLHNALQWLRAVQWLACRMRTGPLSTTGRHATLELRFLFSCNAPFKIFRDSPVLTHS